MKKYEKYKDSGSEWLGEIPHGWEYTRLKNLVSEPLKYGANEQGGNENRDHPRYIRITDFGSDGKLKDDTFKSLSPAIADQYLLKEGDLLFARSGATVGKTFLFHGFNGKACYAGYLIKASFHKEKVSSKYINYFTQSSYFENWKESIFHKATIQNISAEKYNLLKITIPRKLPEQIQIAAYLDHKTAQIDDLISKKERLIELLKEERTALINQAVTKGLDPTVPMKDSGIEWLGEIPAHWEVPKMKFITEFILDGTHGTHPRVSKGYRLLSVRNIVKGKFVFRDDDSRVSWDEYESISSKFKIRKNDIQLAIVGATLGKVALVTNMNEEFVTQRSLATIRANESLCNSEFLHLFMKSEAFQSYLWMNTGFSAQPGVYLGTLQNCSIPIPDISEQLKLVKVIIEKDRCLGQTITNVMKEIALLKEYKTALISEAVTGKIDIRDEVIPSPGSGSGGTTF